MTQILDALVEQNPWWKGEFALGYRPREAYRRIEKALHSRFIVALTGLRRTGKTTLLLRIGQEAIRRGTNPKDVVYFSFDEFRAADIRQVLREYEALLNRRFGERRTILLLDEIQKLPGWQDQLKALYDAWGLKVKACVSGSESLFLRRGSKETLAGRLLEYAVEPLSFREYLDFRGQPTEPVGLYAGEIARAFPAYVRSLGFPELVDVTDRDVIRKYVRESLLSRVLYRDLPGIVRIRDPAALESLVNLLLEEPGQIWHLADLGRDLGLTRQTASQYVTLLERAFLLRKLYNYSRSRRKTERKLKRYYPAVISPDLAFRTDDQSRARVLEWVVVTRLRAEFFWRDARRNEVDAVLTDGRPVPVEVKSGRVDISGILAFLREFGGARGYVASSAIEETRRVGGKEVRIVPAHKLLLAPPVQRR